MSNNIHTSFSLQIKEEVIQKNFKKCCKTKLLVAMIRDNFSLEDNDRFSMYLSSEIINDYFIKYLLEFFPETKIITNKVKRNKYSSYHNVISNASHILQTLELINAKKELNIYFKIQKQHCKRAYIAGLFITSGSINSPETFYYHLEISFKDQKSANFFQELISQYQFNFKLINRNHKVIYYIKKSTLVSDFLKLIDAPKSVLIFENQRIERDFINNINRLNNIDVYNYQKSLKAAENHIKIIKYLSDNNLLYLLNSKIKKLINLRLENMEASLEELAVLMNSKYNIKISKSGINHLFRKIKKIYLDNTIKKNIN